jgi:hypothetical protein
MSTPKLTAGNGLVVDSSPLQHRRCNGRCASLSADLELARSESAKLAASHHRQMQAEYGKREALDSELAQAHAEIERLKALLNTQQTHDWTEAVKVEAAHQRQRWGADNDAGKTPADWFWLIGYLAGKALHAACAGNTDKALHHTISAGAALANWHAALSGADTRMRPGIDPVAKGIEGK